MGTFINLTGKRFGRLVVLKRDRTLKSGRISFKCKCNCGNFIVVTSNCLQKGTTKSCGCLRRYITSITKWKHGHAQSIGSSVTRTYGTWGAMKARCLNSKNVAYKHYGGRGITVCARWLHSFENFLEDMGERPIGKTIDRINNNGNYTPSNCRWATKSEQNKNQRRNK